MKLRLTYKRPSGPAVDIEVQADASATVAHLAERIVVSDPFVSDAAAGGEYTLQRLDAGSASAVLAAESAIGEVALGSGAVVTLVDGKTRMAESAAAAKPLLRLVVEEGPDRGKSFDLSAGTHYLGREQGSDVQLSDPLVSKAHARIDVSEQGVRIIDMNSANGLVIDGGLVPRLDVQDGQAVLLGDSLVRFGLLQTFAAAPVAAGPVAFNRSPRVERRYPGKEFVGPEIPSAHDNTPFPWLAMVAPLIMGATMFLFTRSPMSLVFVALSPVLMAGNYFSNLLNRKRKSKLDNAKFDEQLAVLERELSEEVGVERAARLGEHPATMDVYEQSMRLGPMLWTRRPEHWSFLSLRLGLGRLPSRNTVTSNGEEAGLPDQRERFRTLVDKHVEIDGVPVPESLHQAGALGVAGDRQQGADTARSLLVQLTGLHSPAELVVTALVGPQWTSEFEWLKWLPHTGSPQSPISGSHLADSAATGAALLSALEEIIEMRMARAQDELPEGESGSAEEGRGATMMSKSALVRGALVGEDADAVLPPEIPTPAVVLLLTDDAPVERARLVQLCEKAADAGILPIWVSDSVEALPAVARTHLVLSAQGGEGSIGYVRLGEQIDGVAVESITADQALAFAKRLAPVADAGALIEDASDLPRNVSMVSLFGSELASSPQTAVERWRQNASIHDRSGAPPVKSKRAGRLRALVGQAGLDAMHLDLRGQGPHALVGGTTGSGKSEFLQAWVLGMAAEYSPDRVTFLFVDYKGGSAFADCVNLPHCVGLVTDLNPHLVRRALTSLRAELRHREHLLNRKKAKDLLELERRGDPESPPALVLVIDEFAALVGEVPEFVDGVVDIAQRGRSLGIHLIMATQRPAGVIKDNLRANTNLRIALRMADEADSVDVVGDSVAARFDPGIPGRAIAKTGPGRLMSFQSGYAGGWTTDAPPPPSIDIAELRFGATTPWELPETHVVEQHEEGPTDQARLVQNFSAAAAAAKIPAPRRPWLDELATSYDLSKLRQRTDAELLLGVVDVPERQEQREVYFTPDVDGSILIYGASGSGKSTALRTLAAAAGITPRGGPVQVFGLDFGTGSLRMLEALPHVGSIIGGDDPERVIRLLRTVKAELERRGEEYPAVDAGTITDYRRLAKRSDEPRILLLIDGFAAFRQEFETVTGRTEWYDVAMQVLTEGRQLGVHMALAADRPGGLPSSISGIVQRKVVLRLADDSAYALLDVPRDILATGSPPGRAIVDGCEAQIATVGGSSVVAEQAAALQRLAVAMERAGVAPTPPIASLGREFLLSDLPSDVGGLPVLGVAEESLAPIGFDPTGVFLIAGPPGSGRSNLLAVLSSSLQQARPDSVFTYFGNARSELGRSPLFSRAAVTVDSVVDLATALTAEVASDATGKNVVIIEGLSEFLSTQADGPLVDVIKAIKRGGGFLIAESESSSLGSSWPLIAEVKNGRYGFVLQPDTLDGELLLKTPLPRVTRADFPVGRGFLLRRGTATRIQTPLLRSEEDGTDG